MNDNKKVVVILVNYNNSEDTIETIASIKKSTVPVDIVVVDNASIKSDFIELERHVANDMLLLRSESNVGFAGGNNLAIREALENNSYDYFLLLNNDTVIAEDMIEKLLEYSGSETIVVPKMLYYASPDIIWYGGGKINRLTGRAEHVDMGVKEKNSKLKIPCQTLFATGCCMLIPKNVFKRIGLLDETYFMYCEDTEFCLRANKFGIKILYQPYAKLWHKVSRSTGGGDSDFSLYYMTRNRLRYISDYKNQFYIIAKIVTKFTRYIRIIQYSFSDPTRSRAILKGLQDSNKGVKGAVPLV